jgi:hypothetical protein
VGGLLDRRLAAGLLRMTIAAGLMGPAAWLSARAIESRLGTHGLAAQVIGGLGPVVLGVLVYFGASRLLRLGEARALTAVLGGCVAGNGAR